jgi:PAP2 superfamily protein
MPASCPRYRSRGRATACVASATIVAIALAGCAQQPDRVSTDLMAQPAPSPWALPTSTMQWNDYACNLIAQYRAGQFPASRTLAYLNLAINNGIVAAQQQGRKPDGAAAGAAAAVPARILALMHMASVDATIACHDSKYVYWVPRPTQVDPGIVLAIGVPNHPSYPSNHACISGTNGLVLDAIFPDQRGRYFAMGRQAGESRVYAGIHYRIDLDSGFAIAHKVRRKPSRSASPPIGHSSR